MENADASKQAPRPATIEQLLAALDEQYGGTSGWLRAHGWTDADAAALRAKLLQ
jgi:protein-tyrosine phosphatase